MRVRALAKEVIYNGMNLVGLPNLARRRLTQKLIILTYHSFREEATHSVMGAMPITRFEKQVRFLKRHFHIVPLSAALPMLAGDLSDNNQDARPNIAITIDDGFADNYDLMFRLARKYEVPVTVFVATDFLDTGRPPWPTQVVEILNQTSAVTVEYPVTMPLNNEISKNDAMKAILALWKHLSADERFRNIAELRKHLRVSSSHISQPLTWDQVREMRDGGIDFGSHTVYHGYLPSISAAQAAFELGQSKRRIEEELQNQCILFAYPNGDWDEKSESLIKDEGYELAVTQDRGANSALSDPHSLRRIEVPYDELLGTFACRNSLIAF